MWSFPAYCLMYIYSTLLTAKGSIHLLNRISAFVVVISLCLHYFMITHYQALGAAYVVLISEWLVAALVIFYAHKQCNLPHNYPWLSSHLGFVIFLLLLASLIGVGNFEWQMKLLLLLFSSFILLFVFRFWRIAQIKELLSKKEK